MEIQLSGYTVHQKHETKAHRFKKKDEHIVLHVQINRVKSKMKTHSIPAIRYTKQG
jgi:hypothetical protein